jgi:hypothetical protein
MSTAHQWGKIFTISVLGESFRREKGAMMTNAKILLQVQESWKFGDPLHNLASLTMFKIVAFFVLFAVAAGK